MRVIGAAVPAGRRARHAGAAATIPISRSAAIIQTIEHPHHAAFKMAGWPVRFNGKTAAVKPAPLLGQHSAEVLKDWLGMSEEQVAALRAEKIIHAQPSAEVGQAAVA